MQEGSKKQERRRKRRKRRQEERQKEIRRRRKDNNSRSRQQVVLLVPQLEVRLCGLGRCVQFSFYRDLYPSTPPFSHSLHWAAQLCFAPFSLSSLTLCFLVLSVF